MITAVDTNILLDIFLPDPEFGDISKRLLRQAYDEGALIACDIVYAELVPQFSDRSLLNEALEKINVSTSSSTSNTGRDGYNVGFISKPRSLNFDGFFF